MAFVGAEPSPWAGRLCPYRKQLAYDSGRKRAKTPSRSSERAAGVSARTEQTLGSPLSSGEPPPEQDGSASSGTARVVPGLSSAKHDALGRGGVIAFERQRRDTGVRGTGLSGCSARNAAPIIAAARERKIFDGPASARAKGCAINESILRYDGLPLSSSVGGTADLLRTGKTRSHKVNFRITLHPGPLKSSWFSQKF